jgi:hypothetical protein
MGFGIMHGMDGYSGADKEKLASLARPVSLPVTLSTHEWMLVSGKDAPNRTCSVLNENIKDDSVVFIVVDEESWGTVADAGIKGSADVAEGSVILHAASHPKKDIECVLIIF